MLPLNKTIKRLIIIAGAVGAVLAVAFVVAFEPVTRSISTDDFCSYCHLENEYDPRIRMSWSRPMKATVEGDELARCVDCHLPPGIFMPAVYAISHYLSLTDLFGHLRDIDGERLGKWLPQRAKTAYRVRDRLYQHDGVTCRTCHDTSKFEPKSEAGQMAHESASVEGTTCIECHYNLVHRAVDLRETGFGTRKPNQVADNSPAPGSEQ